MTDVRPLYVASNRAAPTAVLDSDTILVGGIKSGTGGGAVGIYDDAFTTTLTIGGGASQTSMTLSKTGQTATFLGSVTIDENLTVSGTTTTLDTTNLSISDDLIVLRGDASGIAADEAGIVFERGTTSANDALFLWNEADTRFELGLFASSNGTVSPTGAIASGSLSPLRLGDTLTLDDGGVGAATINTTSGDSLTVQATGAALTAGTTGAFAMNMQTNGSTRWTISSTGHLVAGADNTYDIGTNGTDSPRTIRADTSVIAAVGGASPVTISSGAVTGGTTLTVAATGSNTVSLTGFGTTYGLNAGAVALSTTAQTIIESINEIYASIAGTDLQSAYEAGNTIVTDAGNGDFDVSGTEGISLDAGAASNFTVDNAALTLSTTTAGDIIITAAEAVDVNAAAGVTIDCSNFSIDSTSASNVTVTGSAQSLTLAAAGGGAQSVIVNSAGTGANAIDLNATAGGVTVDASSSISLDASTASNFTVSGATADLTLGARGTTITLNESGEESLDGGFAATSIIGALNELYGVVATPVSLQGAYENGNTIVTDAGNGAFDVSGTEAISLDSTGLAGNFTLTANSASNAILSFGSTNAGAGEGRVVIAAKSLVRADSDADIELAAIDTVAISGDTAVTIDSTGLVSIDAATSSNFTVTGSAQSLTLEAAGGGAQSVVINSAGTGVNAIDLNATAGGVSVDASGAISIDAGAASNFSTSTGTLTLESGTNSDLILNGDEGVDINAFGSGVTIDGPAFSIDSTSASNVTVTGGNLTVSTVTSGNLVLTGAADVDINAANDFTMDAGLSFSIDATPGIAANSNITLAANSAASHILAINATNAGAGDADISMTVKSGFTVNVTAGDFSLNSTTASNLTVSGATADLTLGARGATITLNEVGETALDAAFTATSIIGALNELITYGSQVELTAGAGGIAESRLVYISAANTVLLADASAESTAQVIGFAPAAISAAAQGKIQLAGVGSVFVQPGEGSLAANDVLFLSETAGAATKTAPETSGSVRQVIGYVLDPTGYDDTNGSAHLVVFLNGPRFINP